MEFLRLLFKLFVGLSLVCLLSYLGVREYVLLQASQDLEKKVLSLVGSELTQTSYRRCLELGTGFDRGGESLVTPQLRFISDREYVLENLCAGFEFSPIVLGNYTLPMGVVKKPGSSGVVLASGAYSLSLLFRPEWLESVPLPEFLLSREKTLFFEDKRVVEKLSQETDNVRPATLCAGYGFECCDQVTAVGQGDSLPATDCSEGCFERCVPKPLVLSFSAKGYDQYSRSLSISRNGQAEFFFTASAKPKTVVGLDFGDGQSWQGDLSTQTVNHTYDCSLSICEYIANITLTDPQGLSSYQNQLSSITVTVE